MTSHHLAAIGGGAADIVNGMRGLHGKFCGFGDILLVEFFLREEFFRFLCVDDDRGDGSQGDRLPI